MQKVAYCYNLLVKYIKSVLTKNIAVKKIHIHFIIYFATSNLLTM